jgi:hypothetical protein
MTLEQFLLLIFLDMDDTARANVTSDGDGDTAEINLTGTLQIKHAELKEMVERNWIDVDSDGSITMLNDGAVALTTGVDR